MYQMSSGMNDAGEFRYGCLIWLSARMSRRRVGTDVSGECCHGCLSWVSALISQVSVGTDVLNECWHRFTTCLSALISQVSADTNASDVRYCNFITKPFTLSKNVCFNLLWYCRIRPLYKRAIVKPKTSSKLLIVSSKVNLDARLTCGRWSILLIFIFDKGAKLLIIEHESHFLTV